MLRLITTRDDARGLSTDLVEICRPEGLRDITDLGLTLPEAKQLLARFNKRSFRGRPTAMGSSGRAARPAAEDAT